MADDDKTEIPGSSLGGLPPEQPIDGTAEDPGTETPPVEDLSTGTKPDGSDADVQEKNAEPSSGPFYSEGTVRDGDLDESGAAERRAKEDSKQEGDTRSSVFEPPAPEDAEEGVPTKQGDESEDPEYVVSDDQYYTVPEPTTWTEIAEHFEVPNPAVAGRELAAINGVTNGYPRVGEGVTILLWQGYTFKGKKGVSKNLKDDALLPTDRD